MKLDYVFYTGRVDSVVSGVVDGFTVDEYERLG